MFIAGASAKIAAIPSQQHCFLFQTLHLGFITEVEMGFMNAEPPAAATITATGPPSQCSADRIEAFQKLEDQRREFFRVPWASIRSLYA